jgi:hypothetical protein
VLAPGQPACFHHRENEQEDFLVLSGEDAEIAYRDGWLPGEA